MVDSLRQKRREMIIDLFKGIKEEDRTNYLRILAMIKDKLVSQEGKTLK